MIKGMKEKKSAYFKNMHAEVLPWDQCKQILLLSFMWYIKDLTWEKDLVSSYEYLIHHIDIGDSAIQLPCKTEYESYSIFDLGNNSIVKNADSSYSIKSIDKLFGKDNGWGWHYSLNPLYFTESNTVNLKKESRQLLLQDILIYSGKWKNTRIWLWSLPAYWKGDLNRKNDRLLFPKLLGQDDYGTKYLTIILNSNQEIRAKIDSMIINYYDLKTITRSAPK
jgi:hypothetical protein